jgi:antitoxin MazE
MSTCAIFLASSIASRLGAVRTELIHTGNSRGIRIPKQLIEQCGLGDKVELRVESDRLVTSPERRPRQGRGEAFCAAGPVVADELLLQTAEPNVFDRQELAVVTGAPRRDAVWLEPISIIRNLG